MIEIPATRGAPYRVTRDNKGIVRLLRKTEAGHMVIVVFSPADVVNVTNALHDLMEGAA